MLDVNERSAGSCAVEDSWFLRVALLKTKNAFL